MIAAEMSVLCRIATRESWGGARHKKGRLAGSSKPPSARFTVCVVWESRLPEYLARAGEPKQHQQAIDTGNCRQNWEEDTCE